MDFPPNFLHACDIIIMSGVLAEKVHIICLLAEVAADCSYGSVGRAVRVLIARRAF